MNTTRRPVISTLSRPRVRHGAIPLGSEFIVILAILFSVLFILSVSLAFVNSEATPQFRDVLNDVASKKPGIVFLGENVDMDVHEPSVTIRWSALGCGTDFILPGSAKLHGSSACGLPAIPLEVFVDDAADSLFKYDPGTIPTNPTTNLRSIVQSQIQFDSDHVLDVHNARLYPFDTYLVSTSMRATSSNSSEKDIPISIGGLPVLKLTSSFSVSSDDTAVLVMVDGEEEPARHLEMFIARPGDARTYAMLLFGVNWVLSHFNFGIVILSVFQGRWTKSAGAVAFIQQKERRPKDALKHLAGVLAVLLVIPQLRDAMPDAPGFDGVLIDNIGFFPQMTLAGLSAIVLMLILAKRELDRSGEEYILSDVLEKGLSKRSVKVQSLPEEYGGFNVEPSPLPRRVLHETHAQELSARDVMMARVKRTLDAGSRAFWNDGLGRKRT